jgi:hypothetical protein
MTEIQGEKKDQHPAKMLDGKFHIVTCEKSKFCVSTQNDLATKTKDMWQ